VKLASREKSIPPLAIAPSSASPLNFVGMNAAKPTAEVSAQSEIAPRSARQRFADRHPTIRLLLEAQAEVDPEVDAEPEQQHAERRTPNAERRTPPRSC
jgi:hypothetical protein